MHTKYGILNSLLDALEGHQDNQTRISIICCLIHIGNISPLIWLGYLNDESCNTRWDRCAFVIESGLQAVTSIYCEHHEAKIWLVCFYQLFKFRLQPFISHNLIEQRYRELDYFLKQLLQILSSLQHEEFELTIKVIAGMNYQHQHHPSHLSTSVSIQIAGYLFSMRQTLCGFYRKL